MDYPKSLGLVYSAITQMLGYKPMEDEYIVMGLAAYGEPIIDFEYLLDENCHKGIKLPKGTDKNSIRTPTPQAALATTVCNIRRVMGLKL